MTRALRPAVLALLLFSVLLGVLYPLGVTGVSQLLLPRQANGSRVYADGRLVGSALLGQSFAGDLGYFQSRPSAGGYDPLRTGASNLGPNSRVLAAELRARLRAYLRRERRYDPRLASSEVPADAVTASGSGVDPDISPANARIQAHRVAAVRGIPIAQVLQLVARHTDGSAGGLLGAEAVNVLELNLALDRLSVRRAGLR